MNELKNEVETLAKDLGKSELEIITSMQAKAEVTHNHVLTSKLSALKQEYAK